jgi:hypothetical protein
MSGEGGGNVESLGRQTIEGVEADGQRVTVTIHLAGWLGAPALPAKAGTLNAFCQCLWLKCC